MSDHESGPLDTIAAFAPGRVNLIGEHTDYTGGLAMPIAIQLGTEVTFHPDESACSVELSSSLEPDRASVRLDMPDDAIDHAMVFPEWARYIAGVVTAIRPRLGGKGNIMSDLPLGAGLSSSASLEVAVALALGFEGTPRQLALVCQQSEHIATGLATGILDQLTIAEGRAGHAMMIDCGTLDVRHLRVPGDVEIVVIHSGDRRSVAGSAYADRQRECAEAEAEIGPLRASTPRDVDRISNAVVRRRARHVVSENDRVRAFFGAFEHGDLREAGRLMNDSHQSLSMDYDVSTREIDRLVGWLQGVPGVFGARLTGAGFGGCVVALSRPGVLAKRLTSRRAFWTVRASQGAHVR